MTLWYEGPLAGVHSWATGADAERDRIVTVAVVVQETPAARPRITRWLVSPGIPVPPSDLHGLAEEQLQRHGRWPAPVLEEVARALVEQCAAARPLVVMDAPAGLTLLDRELRRHRAASLPGYLERVPLHVLDPRLLDGHLDRYRKGRRALTDLCRTYGVPRPEARDTAAFAFAALEVTRALGHRFASRLERLSAADLHALQARWYHDRPRGPLGWLARTEGAETTAPSWPLRPDLAPAGRPIDGEP
ncbi:3'-5' exonuclease [Streptomyces sp. NPDC057638]|uniref:3'-5' exonuclease n=1 Tax=Streptomyces sp. NPDC057638 TaxID=3346190 RepID=UPI0036A2E39D